MDTLQSLVEKNLVRFSVLRYWMLETMRQYADERLDESGEGDFVRNRHAVHQASVAVALAAATRERSPAAFRVLTSEHDNMRSALSFTLERDNIVTAGELMSALWFYWLTTGRGREAASWADRYLRSNRERVPPLDRYSGDDAVAEILRFTGDRTRSAVLKRELVALGIAHPEAEVHGVAMARLTAGGFSDLAWMELAEGRIAEARSCADEALAIRRAVGLPGGVAHALTAVAGIEFHESNYEQALALFSEAAAVYESEDDSDAIETRLRMAQCELLLGLGDAARSDLRTTLPGRRRHVG